MGDSKRGCDGAGTAAAAEPNAAGDGAHSAVALPVINEKRGGMAGRSAKIRPSKATRRRFAVLIIIQLLIIAHIIQWAVTGTTTTPVEPSEAMELTKHGVINVGAIFFGLALLSTLVLGRWFCGWGCHLVLLQDGCAWVLKKLGVSPKPFRSRLLIYIPLILAIYMFIWPLVFRFGVAPLSEKLNARWESIPVLSAGDWPGFQVQATTQDFWKTFAGWAMAIPFLGVCGFATVYFLGSKGFCTYGCPYGGFFVPLDTYSPMRIRVTDACNQCGHCTAVCTSNVRVHEEVRDYGMVVDPGCMKHLDCVSVCPNNALYFGFGKPAVMKGKGREKAPNRARAKRYDLSIPEEIGLAAAFAITFFAFRGLYGAIPMLMAVGMALCSTFILWKSYRLVRDRNVSFQRMRLRFHGRLTNWGWAFAALGAIVLLLIAHSATVQAGNALGGWHDGQVRVPKAVVFSDDPPPLDEETADSIEDALGAYEFAAFIGDGGIGFWSDPEHEARRAWLHACRQEYEEAERILRTTIARHGYLEGVCRDIGLLMLLDGRGEEALAFYERVLEASPRFTMLWDDAINVVGELRSRQAAVEMTEEALRRNEGRKAETLQLTRRLSTVLLDVRDYERAIAVTKRTIQLDPKNAYGHSHLARCYLLNGQVDEAVESMRTAVEMAPGDPELNRRMASILDDVGRKLEAEEYRERARRLEARQEQQRGGRR